MNLRSLLTCALLAIVGLLGAGDVFAARTTTYLHNDGLGSVVAATNEAGQVLWRKNYAPFGEQMNPPSTTVRTAYTGKDHDEAIGLTNFGARQYDPETGRFLSVDPVGFVENNPMSFNRYAYVNNNPYKHVDPDGEFLNFAAKFVLDVGINVAFNYVTTGQMDVGGALKDSAVGILNPAKTVAKLGKLAHAVGDTRKAQKASDKAPCPLSCFVAGTAVLTERGYVPIETLKEGDQVWAHDPDTGATTLKPIVRTFVNTKDTVWNLVIEKDGFRNQHQVTGSHPYYVVDAGWIEVAHLQPGAVFLTEGGATAVLKEIVHTGEVITTYNFEVADINTYFVSAAKVLVHNCGGDKLTSRAARRQAMRDQGIPTSQQPVSQSRNASGREYSYEIPAPGGGTQRMSVQQQTLDRSHPGQAHWEAGRVKTDPLTGEARMNNYGRPALSNDKSKVDY